MATDGLGAVASRGTVRKQIPSTYLPRRQPLSMQKLSLFARKEFTCHNHSQPFSNGKETIQLGTSPSPGSPLSSQHIAATTLRWSWSYRNDLDCSQVTAGVFHPFLANIWTYLDHSRTWNVKNPNACYINLYILYIYIMLLILEGSSQVSCLQSFWTCWFRGSGVSGNLPSGGQTAELSGHMDKRPFENVRTLPSLPAYLWYPVVV